MRRNVIKLRRTAFFVTVSLQTITTTTRGTIMSINKRSNFIFLQAGLLAACVSALAFSGVASAEEEDAGGASNNECPVGLVKGETFDEEFGYGTSDLTRCLDRRHNVKVVMQINKPCRDSWVNDAGEVKNNVAKCRRGEEAPLDFGRSYALGNINNMIKDYEITHGMVVGKDYEIAAIVHSGGGYLLLKDSGYDGDGKFVEERNKFQPEVENLMARGVKFYFCQNTTRGFIKNGTLPAANEAEGGATAQLIDGVEYVTAGVTSISEFQQRGYKYVQP